MILFAFTSTKITTQKSGQTLARLSAPPFGELVLIRQQKMKLIIYKNKKTARFGLTQSAQSAPVWP